MSKTKTPPARGVYGPLGRRRAAEQGATPETDLAARIEALKARRPARPAAETPRYGRKGMPGMVQLNVAVPVEVKERLVALAAAHDLRLAEAAELVLDRGLAALDGS